MVTTYKQLHALQSPSFEFSFSICVYLFALHWSNSSSHIIVLSPYPVQTQRQSLTSGVSWDETFLLKSVKQKQPKKKPPKIWKYIYCKHATLYFSCTIHSLKRFYRYPLKWFLSRKEVGYNFNFVRFFFIPAEVSCAFVGVRFWLWININIKSSWGNYLQN